MKNIVIIGSTGSVGKNALEIIRAHRDLFHVTALAADANVDELKLQIEEFKPEVAVMSNPIAAEMLRKFYSGSTRILCGPEGLLEIAVWKGADLVLAASSGSSSLLPVLAAIEAGKTIAFANKELLVMAGRVVMETARRRGVKILPVDSEHNAIFQCLEGERNPAVSVRKIILTGSGGPLRDVPRENFRGLSKETVIRHPRWSMGKKISVDSATMMNKGLEILEARWLFDVGPDRIEVVIHPEAVIHSMVEFVDGTVLAQAGPTDMKLPLIHCLGYPERVNHPELFTRWSEIGSLNFLKPDTDKFPCLGMAIDVARRGDTTLSTVLNAADEIAVAAFLADQIDFADIPSVIERVLSRHQATEHPALKAILSADAWAREEASRSTAQWALPARIG
jgi:1-deoxy-D-xylulose-5-phosphate reductoisomerase